METTGAQRARRWREENPDRVRAQTARRDYREILAWRRANPDRIRAYNHVRRGAGRACSQDLTDIRAMSDGVCAYCLAAPSEVLEHCTPVVRGGATDVSNCVMACRVCNARKGAKTPLEFLLGMPIIKRR